MYFEGGDGHLRAFTSTYANSVRTDAEYFDIYNTSTTTFLATGSNNLRVQSQTNFSANVVMDQSLIISGNLINFGSLFSCNLNVWVDRPANDRDLLKIGYAWRINSNDQLELIKYSAFSNGANPSKEIYKKVAVFGGVQPMTSNDTSDSSYLVFDDLNSVVGGGAGGNTIIAGGGTVTLPGVSSNLMAVAGTDIQVSASIIPDQNEVYDLGSATKRWKDLHVSSGTVWLGDTKLSVDANNNVVVQKSDGTPATILVKQMALGSNIFIQPNATGDGVTLTKVNQDLTEEPIGAIGNQASFCNISVGDIASSNIVCVDFTSTTISSSNIATTSMTSSNVSASNASAFRIRITK